MNHNSNYNYSTTMENDDEDPFLKKYSDPAINSKSKASKSNKKSGVRLRACDICHLRKVKCDKIQPSCSNCSKHAVPCTYLIASGKKQGRKAEKKNTANNKDKPESSNRNNYNQPKTPINEVNNNLTKNMFCYEDKPRYRKRGLSQVESLMLRENLYNSNSRKFESPVVTNLSVNKPNNFEIQEVAKKAMVPEKYFNISLDIYKVQKTTFGNKTKIFKENKMDINSANPHFTYQENIHLNNMNPLQNLSNLYCEISKTIEKTRSKNRLFCKDLYKITEKEENHKNLEFIPIIDYQKRHSQSSIEFRFSNSASPIYQNSNNSSIHNKTAPYLENKEIRNNDDTEEQRNNIEMKESVLKANINQNVEVTAELIQQLVALYFIHINSYQLLIHKESFYAELYGKKEHGYSFLALLNAICLAGCGHFTHKTVAPMLSQIFSYRVQFYIKRSYFQRDLNTLTTLALISQFIVSHENDEFMNQGWYYSMLAYRKAIDIGLHRECKNVDKTDQEIRRRIWWTMYITDRQYCFCVGRQKTLQEYICNLKLPSYDPEIDYLDSSTQNSSQKTNNPTAQLNASSQFHYPNNELSLAFFKSFIIYCHLLGGAAILNEQFKNFRIEASPHIYHTEIEEGSNNNSRKIDYNSNYKFELIDSFSNHPYYAQYKNKYLLLENKFHQWYIELPRGLRTSKRLDFVTVPFGKEPFTSILHIYYFSVLIEFNKLHVHSDDFKSIDMNYVLQLNNGVQMNEFKARTPLMKCIIAAHLGTRIVMCMGNNFVIQSPSYKWWCILNFVVVHLKIAIYLKNNYHYHNNIKENNMLVCYNNEDNKQKNCELFIEETKTHLSHLYHLIQEGSHRWNVVKNVNILVKNLLKESKILVV